MILSILRGVFILLAATVTMLYVLQFLHVEDESLKRQREASRQVWEADREAWVAATQAGRDAPRPELHPADPSATGIGFGHIILVAALTLGAAGSIVAVDLLTPHKKLSAVAGVFLGLIAGLVAAYALSFVVDLFGLIYAGDDPKRLATASMLLQGVKIFIGLVTCYTAISLVIQTKDDFRFVIPYVEFAKEVRGSRPTLLDTSVIIDGRILDIAQTRLIQGGVIVPRFVLNELQLVADSPDKLRRARGRRGLDTLQKLQDSPTVEVTIAEAEAEGTTVDQKLVSLAQTMQARVMTNDFNLNKIATLRGVEVINLNDLAKAMRPVVLPGEVMRVRIIKPGEGQGQGVGYLDDGTMVVVENARHLTGQEANLIVTSTLQTSAGRMIFGRHNFEAEAPVTHGGAPATSGGATSGGAASGGMASGGGEGHGAADADSAGAEGGDPNRPNRPSPYGRNPRRGH